MPKPANGVLLWFGEVPDFDQVVVRAEQLKAPIVRAPHRNPPEGQGNGPGHREIWIKDLDGYIVVVASPDGEAYEPSEGSTEIVVRPLGRASGYRARRTFLISSRRQYVRPNASGRRPLAIAAVETSRAWTVQALALGLRLRPPGTSSPTPQSSHRQPRRRRLMHRAPSPALLRSSNSALPGQG